MVQYEIDRGGWNAVLFKKNGSLHAIQQKPQVREFPKSHNYLHGPKDLSSHAQIEDEHHIPTVGKGGMNLEENITFLAAFSYIFVWVVCCRAHMAV